MERRRRLTVAMVTAGMALASVVFGAAYHSQNSAQPAQKSPAIPTTSPVVTSSPALKVLSELPVKGRAPKTGYSRAQFGNGWQDLGNCDVRNYILARDMEQEVVQSDTDCRVISGTLHDPYTGTTITFIKGPTSSSRVQIDHVVALSDAWQKGAQQLTAALRLQLANDPLNLLAVDGPANNQKSDADAATWLPPHKGYRCRYVARQLAVKQKYSLWLTQGEHDAIGRVLGSCPDQVLPLVTP